MLFHPNHCNYCTLSCSGYWKFGSHQSAGNSKADSTGDGEEGDGEEVTPPGGDVEAQPDPHDGDLLSQSETEEDLRLRKVY